MAKLSRGTGAEFEEEVLLSVNFFHGLTLLIMCGTVRREGRSRVRIPPQLRKVLVAISLNRCKLPRRIFWRQRQTARALKMAISMPVYPICLSMHLE